MKPTNSTKVDAAAAYDKLQTLEFDGITSQVYKVSETLRMCVWKHANHFNVQTWKIQGDKVYQDHMMMIGADSAYFSGDNDAYMRKLQSLRHLGII